ncbi:hypothetical protein JW992_00425 [candidate division KSB1 bacterium]|nr:hypothetical protein [candidate division KSB1 bacterium]
MVFKSPLFFVLVVLIGFFLCWRQSIAGDSIGKETLHQTMSELQEKYPQVDSKRIEHGVQQTALLWQTGDGTPEDFKNFCLEAFIADSADLSAMFLRVQDNLEQIYGHALQVSRFLSQPLQLDNGAVLPIDYRFAEYNPFAHILDDLFANRIAFAVLLNFPIHSLDERLSYGPQWSRQQWAQSRLTQQFAARVPASISQTLSRAYVKADDYISNYNIYMHRLVDSDGTPLFPQGLKLISHWGLRDELKSQYAATDGLQRQRMIFQVMKRIIGQEIPAAVIDNDRFDWDPYTNELIIEGKRFSDNPEPDNRYRHLLQVFQAEKISDPYYPFLPSKIDRRFQGDREIPEDQFAALLVRLLTDPVAQKAADLVKSRLGRDLEPFDIWYSGFKSRSSYPEAELDRLVAERYPDVKAFQKDLPRILSVLGFDDPTAEFLGFKITVDPSRGAGHAMGAMRKEDNAHLRTRIGKTGMNYKGYNIAIHELGHNVEQVLSLNRMDHYLLQGVPNTAFTEAFAFVFQSRDIELLGLKQNDPAQEHLKALDTFWATCEIAAVGLMDMEVWRWMYDHPEATPVELKSAVIEIARDVWNRYWAPLIGQKDQEILAIYSHLIDTGLYLPDYSLGHIIMFQIEDYLKGKNLGTEMERMCRLGNLTPDAWMQAAVGSPISVEPLIEATRNAIDALQQ